MSGRINGVDIFMKEYTCWDFTTGWPNYILIREFSYQKLYGRFARTKNKGRNNEVKVRRGSTVQ